MIYFFISLLEGYSCASVHHVPFQLCRGCDWSADFIFESFHRNERFFSIPARRYYKSFQWSHGASLLLCWVDLCLNYVKLLSPPRCCFLFWWHIWRRNVQGRTWSWCCQISRCSVATAVTKELLGWTVTQECFSHRVCDAWVKPDVFPPSELVFGIKPFDSGASNVYWESSPSKCR